MPGRRAPRAPAGLSGRGRYPACTHRNLACASIIGNHPSSTLSRRIARPARHVTTTVPSPGRHQMFAPQHFSGPDIDRQYTSGRHVIRNRRVETRRLSVEQQRLDPGNRMALTQSQSRSFGQRCGDAGNEVASRREASGGLTGGGGTQQCYGCFDPEQVHRIVQ